MRKYRSIYHLLILSALLVMTPGLWAQESEKDSSVIFEPPVQLGYNYSKPANAVTSAVDVITSETINSSSALNPMESLYGRLSGLMVLQNGGTIEQRDPTFAIRGKATYRNSNVLVLVDGIERDMSTLVNEEIESVTVLKDGAALAIYGLRGANGVILVTTKQGSFDSYQVNISYDQAINSAFRLPEFLGGYDYARAVNEASILDGKPVIYTDQELADFESGNSPFYPSVDWFDEAFKEYGSSKNFNVNFRGGGKRAGFFVMLNYQNESGLFDESTYTDERYDNRLNYERFNFRSNLDINLTSSTRLKLNVSGIIQDSRRPYANVNNVMSALFSVPSAAFPVQTINDNWGGTEYYDNNPVALIAATGEYTTHQTLLNSNASLFQDLDMLVEGLSAEFTMAYDQNPTFFERKNKDFLYESISVERDQVTGEINDTTSVLYGSEADLNTGNGLSWQRRMATGWGKINYEKEIGEGFLHSSLLYNMDKKVYRGQYNTYLHQNISLLASYDLRQKYIVGFSLTYGGNSLLPEGDRFGFFPAVSGAWILSEEAFLSNSSLVTNLKLRASWGINGNGSIPGNLYDQPYRSGVNYFFTNNINNYGGLREGELATEFITYESANKTNIGIDAELAGKLNLNANLFFENRSGILTELDNTTSAVLGVENSVGFDGEVENKGFDASLLFKDNTGDFNYYIGGNFLFAKNKIINMNEQFRPEDYLYRTGNSVDQQFGLVADGFFADETDIANSPKHVFSEVKPGDVKYVDQNDDGVINQYDEVAIGYGSDLPEIYYSISLGFEFKGIGIDALLQGLSNQTDYLNTKSLFWPLQNQTTISTVAADRWTPETAETATLPRLSLAENNNNYRKNDIWLTDVSYLKLRHVELYYNLPEAMLNKIKTKSLKIYVRGANLYSFDKIQVVDPEATGVVYPTLSSYHVGIKVGF